MNLWLPGLSGCGSARSSASRSTTTSEPRVCPWGQQDSSHLPPELTHCPAGHPRHGLVGSPCVPRRWALGSHGTKMISGPAVSGVTQLGRDPASWEWSCVAQCWGGALTPATLEMILEEVTANHDSAGVLAVFSTHPTPHSGSVFRSSRLACLDRKGRGAEAAAPQAASPRPSRTPPTPCPPVLAWAHRMTESPQGKREVPRSSPIPLLSAHETLSLWPDPWSPRLRDLPFPVAFCAPSSAHPHLLRRGPSSRLSTPHPTLPRASRKPSWTPPVDGPPRPRGL